MREKCTAHTPVLIAWTLRSCKYLQLEVEWYYMQLERIVKTKHIYLRDLKEDLKKIWADIKFILKIINSKNINLKIINK